jgi:carbon-monoxide dehydrogenase small subunit
MKDIRFILNGTSVSVADGSRTLLWTLRTDFQLTGTKYGCGQGLCGACTILVNDHAERSCQLSVKDVEGKNIITIEGLLQKNNLHPVQKAFVEHDALQCGFCTPGMILNAISLLHENPNPTENEIIIAMEDNLCRCGAHNQIVQAIQTAAKTMGGGR